MSNYDMPVVKGAILYNFFIGNYNEPERLVGRIVTKENEPEAMGFRNGVSQRVWQRYNRCNGQWAEEHSKAWTSDSHQGRHQVFR